jgi:hypothetical protein
MRWITIKNTCIDFDRVTHFLVISDRDSHILNIYLEDRDTPDIWFHFDTKEEMDEEFKNIVDAL